MSDKLIIKSSEWFRGQGKWRKSASAKKSEYLDCTMSRLQVGNQYCCLGLACRMDGLPVADAKWQLVPSDFSKDTFDDDKVSRFCEIEAGAVQINDDPRLTDEEKIAKLALLFAEVGVELEWQPNG